jgi:hypothetical protein
MNSEKANDNIPTLTEIVHGGDSSMENHFDDTNIQQEVAEYFDDDNGVDHDKTDSRKFGLEQSYDSIEQHEPFIGDEIEDPDPIYEVDDLIAELDNNEEADEIPVSTDSKIKLSGLEEEKLKRSIDIIISDTVNNVMPEIEQKLTEVLSQQIYQKLFNQGKSK